MSAERLESTHIRRQLITSTAPFMPYITTLTLTVLQYHHITRFRSKAHPSTYQSKKWPLHQKLLGDRPFHHSPWRPPESRSRLPKMRGIQSMFTRGSSKFPMHHHRGHPITCDRNPELVKNAYTPDSIWRNRDIFIKGTDEIVEFLTKKWSVENGYRLRKELFAFTENKVGELELPKTLHGIRLCILTDDLNRLQSSSGMSGMILPANGN